MQQNIISLHLTNSGLGVSSNSFPKSTELDGLIAPPTTPVTPIRTPSIKTCRVQQSEWHRAISEKKRGNLQEELRQARTYKTSLCTAFRDMGQCAYGSQCRYAHNISELRLAPTRHPKYKTKLCNKFTLYGACPYGGRCQFIHKRSYEMQNNLVSFSASLDNSDNNALHYRQCTGTMWPSMHSNGAYGVKIPKSADRCDLLAQQYFGSGNNLETMCNTVSYNHSNAETAQNFLHQHLPNAGRKSDMERMLSVMPRVDFDSTAIDDLFSAMSIGECSNSFTQSCFPRIDFKNCIKKNSTVNSQANIIDL